MVKRDTLLIANAESSFCIKQKPYHINRKRETGSECTSLMRDARDLAALPALTADPSLPFLRVSGGITLGKMLVIVDGRR